MFCEFVMFEDEVAWSLISKEERKVMIKRQEAILIKIAICKH